MKTTGTIIALAWPDTLVVKEGKWYDFLMKLLGFLKNDYYTAGHAACILVCHDTNTLLYHDFGRYHTPSKKGRVRNVFTDPDLKIDTKLHTENGEILNLEEILTEIQNNKACHGNGLLMASVYNNINYKKAVAKANQMQNKGAICYGPLKYKGTNCSRFVSQITKFSTPSVLKKIELTLPYTISASPKFNISVINSYKHYYVIPRDKTNNLPLKLKTELVW